MLDQDGSKTRLKLHVKIIFDLHKVGKEGHVVGWPFSRLRTDKT